jgi:hypothetical protein
MYTQAQELQKLVNQMTAEQIRFDGDMLTPMLEVYADEFKKLSAKEFRGQGESKWRCDAGEDVFLARQLIYIQNRQVNTLFTRNQALQYVPVETDVPVGAEQFTTEQFTQVGAAAFVTNYGTDFPSADVFVNETINRMFDIGSSYRYSLVDLRRAAFAGVPLSAKRAEASRLAHDTKIDEIALSGDTTRSITGIANNANVTILTAGGGTVTGAWEGATAATIKADLAAMESTIVLACAGQSQLFPDTLLLDDESYMILNTRPSTTFSDQTILRSYLANSPYIRNIEPWVKLRNAGAAGVRRGIMYRRNPDVLGIKISQSYEQFAPQQQLMQWVVPAMSRLSGVIVYRPMAMLYIDGLTISPPAGL